MIWQNNSYFLCSVLITRSYRFYKTNSDNLCYLLYQQFILQSVTKNYKRKKNLYSLLISYNLISLMNWHKSQLWNITLFFFIINLMTLEIKLQLLPSHLKTWNWKCKHFGTLSVSVQHSICFLWKSVVKYFLRLEITSNHLHGQYSWIILVTLMIFNCN